MDLILGLLIGIPLGAYAHKAGWFAALKQLFKKETAPKPVVIVPAPVPVTPPAATPTPPVSDAK